MLLMYSGLICGILTFQTAMRFSSSLAYTANEYQAASKGASCRIALPISEYQRAAQQASCGQYGKHPSTATLVHLTTALGAVWDDAMLTLQIW
jgi:hypothetical protein